MSKKLDLLSEIISTASPGQKDRIVRTLNRDYLLQVEALRLRTDVILRDIHLVLTSDIDNREDYVRALKLDAQVLQVDIQETSSAIASRIEQLRESGVAFTFDGVKAQVDVLTAIAEGLMAMPMAMAGVDGASVPYTRLHEQNRFSLTNLHELQSQVQKFQSQLRVLELLSYPNIKLDGDGIENFPDRPIPKPGTNPWEGEIYTGPEWRNNFAAGTSLPLVEGFPPFGHDLGVMSEELNRLLGSLPELVEIIEQSFGVIGDKIAEAVASSLSATNSTVPEATNGCSSYASSIENSLISGSLVPVDIQKISASFVSNGESFGGSLVPQVANTSGLLGSNAIPAGDAGSKATGDLDNQIEKMSELEKAARQVGSTLASSLSGAIASGQGFDNILKQIGNTLQGILQSFIKKGLEKLFEGLFNAIFAGADGAVLSRGQVMPFARGGVVTAPTLFPMIGRRTGLMGEAGPEGILPLRRGRGGRLGVEAGNVSVNIHNNVGADVSTREKSNGSGGTDIEVMIDQTVGRNIARGGMTAKALETRFGLRPATFGR